MSLGVHARIHVAKRRRRGGFTSRARRRGVLRDASRVARTNDGGVHGQHDLEFARHLRVRLVLLVRQRHRGVALAPVHQTNLTVQVVKVEAHGVALVVAFGGFLRRRFFVAAGHRRAQARLDSRLLRSVADEALLRVERHGDGLPARGDAQLARGVQRVGHHQPERALSVAQESARHEEAVVVEKRIRRRTHKGGETAAALGVEPVGQAIQRRGVRGFLKPRAHAFNERVPLLEIEADLANAP
mmetsp:Transcript_5904/g.25073  ORF Transcript_5904/g.25073 Transcript_5904/m.25073 type:complete len:243 (-) Transcript_5904:1249-1977(-)